MKQATFVNNTVKKKACHRQNCGEKRAEKVFNLSIEKAENKLARDIHGNSLDRAFFSLSLTLFSLYYQCQRLRVIYRVSLTRVHLKDWKKKRRENLRRSSPRTWQ